MRSGLSIAAFVACCLIYSALAQAEGDAEGIKFFEDKVRPLLIDKCQGCHGEKKQKGDLRLDSLQAAMEGGESGSAVVPGKPDESPLIDAINYQSFEMPPDGKLSESEIEILTEWVKRGAPWPNDGKATSVKRAAREITDEDRNYWAFRPLAPGAIPQPTRSDWSRNEIDRYLLTRLEAEKINPAPPASPTVLVRRLYQDLTGLPPTVEQVDAFLSDSSDAGYERLVDSLLASPRYGEHAARFWLDLVRYAESDGYKQDTYRPNAWHYRDYVIKSFQDDKPYDRFVLEQLAGDELFPGDPDAVVATGYLRHGIYEYNQRDARGQWRVILEDLTETTADVFLGLGFSCAKCHDHKFDPILQKDYYRLQAFFANVGFRDGVPLVDGESAEDHQKKLKAWEEKTADIRAKLDAIEGPYRKKSQAHAIGMFPEDIQGIMAKAEGDRDCYERQIAHLVHLQVLEEWNQIGSKLKGEQKKQWDELQKELAAFNDIKPKALPCAQAAGDIVKTSPVVMVPDRPKLGEIEPGVPSVFDTASLPIREIESAPESSGRRAALARWLTRPDNQLTTRVIVNRIWQQHFGTGLVASSSDFGRLGEPPSHPELLDWLASGFVSNGWRFKWLHKTIVMSSAYRQSATPAALVEGDIDPATVDPANRLLWRYPVRRLAAEQIRDAMLAVSGELDLQVGGPGTDLNSPRRTIYTKSIRNKHDPLLDVFDLPDRLVSSATRNVTTTPTQSLLLINSPALVARAKKFAERVRKDVPGGMESSVRHAYRLAVSRDPNEVELKRSVDFVSPPDEKISEKEQQTRFIDFCHVLLNSNEFLYVE
jgi:hypothetical protein